MRLPAPVPEILFTSPMLAARQTAQTLGVVARTEPQLSDIGYGDWTGHSFADIHAHDPEALARWIADPSPGAPGGETMDALLLRIGSWMNSLAADVLAITHPMVVRAAIGAALGLPHAALLRIDVAPLSSAVLSFNRVWRLQALQPYAS